jgi:uncharacterized protein with NRDE domain
MCIIYLALGQHPGYPLILAANRDEFYDRPAEPARYWDDHPGIYAGRDLVAGGTWLGVNNSGQFAAVTNYRDPSAPIGELSRGNLVADFLRSNTSSRKYLRSVESSAMRYSGFNLIVGEINARRQVAFYLSNRSEAIVQLEPGIYGLSNHLLDTPWPKVARGKEVFRSLIENRRPDDAGFFELLADKTLADDDDLPDTGIGYEREKLLSAIFIKTPVYGTRCSTVLKIDRSNSFTFEERVFV